MHNLSNFLSFLAPEFLADKTLVVTNIGDWAEYGNDGTPTGRILGKKIQVAITRDDTAYPLSKDGSVKSNLYEKFNVRVAHAVNVSVGDEVKLINPVGTVYGDYRNQLSITADDVVVAKPEKA